MSDLPQFLQDEDKGIKLPALLARLIEGYECSPNRVRYVLRFKHLLGRRSDALKQVNGRTSESLAASELASRQDIFEKALHSPSKYLATYESLLQVWYRDNSQDLQDELTEDEITSWESDFELSEAERANRGELLDDSHFRSTLEREGESFEGNPELKQAIAKELGVGPDIEGFDLALRRYQAFRNDDENRHFAELKSPHAIDFWAKELVGMLPTIAERSLELTSHPIAQLGESIPDSLRVLFEQLHLSYLFGFEIPCTLTCGALVEEAFQVRFQEMFATWDREYLGAKKRGERPHALPFWEKIDRVVARNPFAGPARQLAKSVWDARTRAMHNPEEYIRRDGYESEVILPDARKVLQVLFEPNQSQEGRN